MASTLLLLRERVQSSSALRSPSQDAEKIRGREQIFGGYSPRFTALLDGNHIIIYFTGVPIRALSDLDICFF
eukprot:scaffold8141_cov139-Skeletonema_dohrnii-CCMP3373.AAC.6